MGAIGSVIGGFALGRVTGAASAWAGVAAVALAFGAVAGLAVLMKRLSWRVPQVLALSIGPAFVIVGSVVGIAQGRAEQAENEADCHTSQGQVAVYVAKKDFAAAHNAVSTAKMKCDPSDNAKLTEMDRNVSQQEQAAAKAAADQASADAKAAAAERERKAVASFPARSSAVNAKLASATTQANQGKWVDSDETLDEASSILGEFKDTSVEKTQACSALSKRIEDQRARIKPQLDRIHAKEAADQQKAAAVAAVRGEKPVNSAWDGSVRPCESAIKESLNDADSYQHVSTTQPMIEGPYWTVVTNFRAKNAFGALILAQHKCYIQQGQAVKIE